MFALNQDSYANEEEIELAIITANIGVCSCMCVLCDGLSGFMIVKWSSA